MQTTRSSNPVRPAPRVAIAFLILGAGLVGFAAGSGGSLVPGVVAGDVQTLAQGDAALQLVSTPTSGVLLVGLMMLFAAAVLLLRGATAPTGEGGVRDPASGLYSRQYTEETIPGMLARHDRAGESQLAMVLLSVDFVDHIERRYGPEAVNAVFALLGRHIRSQSRDGDIAARTDVHRIAVFLRCQEIEQAAAFGRRLSMLLAREQLDWRGDVIKITTSMGVVMRELGESIDSLNERAAANLQAARAAGPNSILS